MKDIKKEKFSDLNIGIIGVGLIGGSLAKAFKIHSKVKKIVGISGNIDALSKAKSEGVLDIIGKYEEIGLISDCDIVFVCTPVGAFKNLWIDLSKNIKHDAIITDVGSTKAEILDFMDEHAKEINFIGGHPMAGSERSGYYSSSANLFENAYYILSPGKYSKSESTALLIELVKTIGAIPMLLDRNVHDKSVALISHIPHILAAILVNMVEYEDKENGLLSKIAAGGFKDITRIASSNPSMWRDIILSNGSSILELLEQFKLYVDKCKEYIEHYDSEGIKLMFEQARNYRNSIPSGVKGIIPGMPEVWVDVEDRPGIIGIIASILGESGVNIKNINITNSREYEGGCLRLSFEDEPTAERAKEILSKFGYSVERKL